jgi:DNA mismatch repair protein MutL
MGKVHLLEPLVAERIAAGEVIERPASIVKECVENALDAGAENIWVALEEGGKKTIQITDDGHGMDAEDLKLCTLRHATSKIRELSDLENLQSLGFRGEALPSIQSVAELKIISRAKGEKDAHGYLNSNQTLDARNLNHSGSAPTITKQTFGQFIASPHGTQITVTGLFSQIPARLKFLKSQTTEVSAVKEWMERLSLAFPMVSFQLKSEGKIIFQTRAEEEASRVRTILSPHSQFEVKSFRTSPQASIQLRLHWIHGESLPNTKRLTQVINHRPIRDRLIQQAILAGFKQALLPGQFPALALFLELPPELVDVNVHPTKTEVRFLNSGQVFHWIESAVKTFIQQEGTLRAIPHSFTEPNSSHTTPSGDSQSLNEETSPPSAHSTTHSLSAWDRSRNAPSAPGFFFAENAISVSEEMLPKHQASFSIPGKSNHPFSAHRFIGTLFNTYFLFDGGTEMVLIDQHAAHERIRFETLRARLFPRTGTQKFDLTAGEASAVDERVSAQRLLLPEVIQLEVDEVRSLSPHLGVLEQMGFEVEVFGEKQILFREIPDVWGKSNLTQRLKNLLERLLEKIQTTDSFTKEKTGSLLFDEALFEKLASEACHSSVRAGDAVSNEGALNLVEALFKTEHPWNCPHGRPTITKVTKQKIEEWFQRKI